MSEHNVDDSADEFEQFLRTASVEQMKSLRDELEGRESMSGIREMLQRRIALKFQGQL